MPEEALPDNVRNFVLAKIPSVLQLEILLQLHASRPRFLVPQEMATPLGLDAATLLEQLQQLQFRGLAASQPSPEPAFAYAADSGEQDKAVAELAEAYRSRRVSVISLIYSGPIERIRTFADAFRLRSQKEPPP